MNLIYSIHDRPATLKEWFLYAIQQVLAVFVATVLIANICGTPISSCLVGACVATLIYQLVTDFSSPMFISSCGATCSAVIGALALGNGNNYTAVAIGGAVIYIIYILFALIIQCRGIEAINRIFPPSIVGAITIVIGINLAGFIPTYLQINGVHSNIGICVGIITMIIVALSSHYFKGFWKTVPFLIGLLAGYIISVILTIFNIAPLIDFTIFKDIQLFKLPDFAFFHFNNKLKPSDYLQIIIMFAPVAIAAVMEHYSDHKVLSNIIGIDLTKTPGLHKTLLGDGMASFFGTVICGLPNTSYGESIATTGFSKVASVKVISLAAIMLGILAFIYPVQLAIISIPSCVFGGCAMILYGYIAASGLKTLLHANINFEDNKNLIIVSVILTIGVSGIWLFNEAFAGVSLAMILGVLLNLVLKNKNKI